MPAYRAVVFDFFGTLTRAVRRGPQHEEIARALGADPEAVRGVLDRTFRARARGRYGSAEATLRWVIEQAGGRPRPAQVRAGVPARVSALKADTRLRADAVSVLSAIRRRGLATAVISDCTHELPAFLPGLPVAPLLDAKIYSVRLGVCKPDPRIYLAACAELGVTPAECLYVGDGGSHELSGAAAVGMTPVRLAAPDLGQHLVFDADTNFAGRTVRSLTEVVGVVDRARAVELAPSKDRARAADVAPSKDRARTVELAPSEDRARTVDVAPPEDWARTVDVAQSEDRERAKMAG